jgi:hypothetical protein
LWIDITKIFTDFNQPNPAGMTAYAKPQTIGKRLLSNAKNTPTTNKPIKAVTISGFSQLAKASVLIQNHCPDFADRMESPFCFSKNAVRHKTNALIANSQHQRQLSTQITQQQTTKQQFFTNANQQGQK